MIPRKVRIQVTVFVLLALLAVSYVAVRYVGILRLTGVGRYTVHLELPDTGGIFTNAEVTYRGVPVGRVGDLRLTATGIEVDLQIDSSHKSIPSDTAAVVADRSVIGEQYVDLRPRTDSGPYLANGSVIGEQSATLPPTSGRLLESVNGLLNSVPISAYQTVVGELSTAFNGTSDSLQTLLDSAQAFFVAADQNFPQTTALLDTSATVLRTQQAETQSILSFSTNLQAFAAQLRSSDGTLVKLLTDAPLAAQQVSGLIGDVGTDLGVLIGNLTTTSQVFLANVDGLRGLLVGLPQAIKIGSSVITPQGANVGLAVTFFDPLPCTTGYRGTQRRDASDTSPGQPLNTAAGCTASPSSGVDVRGAQAATGIDPATQSWITRYLATTGATAAPSSSLATLLGSGG